MCAALLAEEPGVDALRCGAMSMWMVEMRRGAAASEYTMRGVGLQTWLDLLLLCRGWHLLCGYVGVHDRKF